MEYVIVKATGDLLRFGFCDFFNDGAFDTLSEKIITVWLGNPKTQGKYLKTKMSRWDGRWIEVDQP